ncbi:MAG: TonB-dependent receptor [Bacteroidia bacterium]
MIKEQKVIWYRRLFYLYLFLLFILFSSRLAAQNLTQTIRGKVFDKQNQNELIGATVVITDLNPVQGCITNNNGEFKLTKVPIGKHSIKVTYIGYKDRYYNDIILNSGKELVLEVFMEENLQNQKEVVIKASHQKDKPLNELSVVSSRTFSVEETQKFAAAINDPSRMAVSFAGVTSTDDGNNQISIRGNSPSGLLYRMEGVEIPNPNHFSDAGTVGGGVSILSSQLMGNSDFITGAFAAEYGNALSGVFDLKLRKGNNEKREFTLQAGFLGFDFASEGPIKKGYAGSYLVNYRYSTLGVISKLGVNIGDAVTTFQDLSFNVSLPTEKYGNFGVFAFGGLSNQEHLAVKDSLKWESSFDKQYRNFISNTGAIGLNHLFHLSKKSYLKSVLVFSGTTHKFDAEEFNFEGLIPKNYKESFNQNKISLSTTYNFKLNAKNNFRSGFIINHQGFDLLQKMREMNEENFIEHINQNGSFLIYQAFSQWQHKFNERLSVNLGFHSLMLSLNNSYSIEPRSSIKYQLTEKQSIGFGYGMHGQTQPIGLYFAKKQLNDGTYSKPNNNLKLNQSQHFVLSYDRMLSNYLKLKLETYYQFLNNLPVSPDVNSSFSTVNNTFGFLNDSLVNNGIGENKGIELSLEQYMHHNFYYLLSVSFYDSKYKAANGNWYNTRFNGNFNLTFTTGKEWYLSERFGKRILGLNIKTIWAGGQRITPIDLEQSRLKGEAVYVDGLAFTQQNPNYFRTDLRVSIKKNRTKSTSIWSLDFQNVSNNKNVGGNYYDVETQTIKTWYQAPLIPVLSYKIEF